MLGVGALVLSGAFEVVVEFVVGAVVGVGLLCKFFFLFPLYHCCPSFFLSSLLCPCPLAVLPAGFVFTFSFPFYEMMQVIGLVLQLLSLLMLLSLFIAAFVIASVVNAFAAVVTVVVVIVVVADVDFVGEFFSPFRVTFFVGAVPTFRFGLRVGSCCCCCRFGGLLRAGSGEMAQLFTSSALRPPALNDHHHELE